VTAILQNRLPLLRGATVVVTALLVVLAGILVALAPMLALGLVGFLALVGLAFLAPATHLTLLLAFTVLVPYGIQNELSPAGAGLVLSDLLLMTGLFRAGIALLREPLDRRRMAALGLIAFFLAVVVLQALHGFEAGRSASQVGHELRVLVAFATFVIAMPIAADRDGPRRIAACLMIVGLLLGCWGLAQWTLGIEEIGESGVGVRQGISFASSGTGQLQGGLYAFPVAVVLSFAALASGRFSRGWSGMVLVAILATNFVSLLLTYERTFWVATVAGMMFVVFKSSPGRRARVALAGLLTAAVLLAGFATLAPNDFTAARERLISLGQYSNDDSVRTRVVETRHVLAQIDESLLVGSGLGATIFWGRAWQDVPPEATWYSHNGYLWVTWKIGLLAALCLFLFLVWATFARPPPGQSPTSAVLRIGSQAALFVLLVSSITFPSFNALEITAVMGVLAALCLTPARPDRAGTRTA
jgi:hypothetical protein